ncbi:MAG: TrkA family potassium uptake protein [Dehalococcoidia bacterium]
MITNDSRRAVAAHDHGVRVVRGGQRGDATEEETLRAAGIERARALIAAADSDVENTYIVLTARALNPRLLIVARAGSEPAERRLASAGADRVISPYRIGGRRMAVSAVQPMLTEFMDTLAAGTGGESGKVLAEILVDDACAGLIGRAIHDVFLPNSGLVVMGVERAASGVQVGPRGDMIIERGDRLMVYGESEAMDQVVQSATPGRHPVRR